MSGPSHLGALADELYAAWRSRTAVPPLRSRSDLPAPLTLADAYGIQQRFVDARLAAGETVVGKKVGATSKAVQDLLGVDRPDFGQLLSGMRVADGGVIDLDRLVQPRAEAELAFVLKADLVGPGITAADVLVATDHVAPCIEIVDSRIEHWDIGIVDTVADNASCGEFVIGEATADPLDVDLTMAGMIVEVDGEIVTTGCGAAVLGGPANAIAWLANTLGELGLPFRAGEVILSGSQSVLVDVEAGNELRCTIGGLGSCSVRFTREGTS